MEAMVERCCGLDVHKEKVVACLLVGAPGRKPTKEMRTFKTYKKEIEKLAQWLAEAGCTQVGMETTGSYWVPIYRSLEESGTFELVLGNAQHIKNVPGRKTDMKDAQWLAELLRHGLVRKSFVPPKPIRELRDLLRYLRGLVDARSTERNRLHKLLETAHVKLASVASDTYAGNKFFRLKARRGFKRAAMAIAHKTLIAAYHILQGQTFIELGAQYLDKLNQARTTKQMVNRLEQLGYSVALTPVPNV